MKHRLGIVWLAVGVLTLGGCGAGSPAPVGGSGGTSGGSGGNVPDGGTGTGGAAGNDAGGVDTGSGGQTVIDGGPDTADSGEVGSTDDPMLLSQTGLYSDTARGVLAPGVSAFQPLYPLWSDSATKRRWVSLPAGMKIDTSEMDFWMYPSGTKLWKEFSRDGVRVETRLLLKKSPGVWFAMAYKWNAGQTDAVAVPAGERNASNTQHDIPSKENCGTCHSPMWDFALGFSALQLSHTLEGLNLDQLKTMGLLTNPPAAPIALPGDSVDKAALGYLHANCGMCHNERSKVYNINVDMDLWTHLDQVTSVNTTRAYLSTVCDQWSKDALITSCGAGHAVGTANRGMISRVPKRITPGMPLVSSIHELMALREMAVVGMRQMPPVGTEIIDPTGIAAVDAWINRLPR